MLRGLGNAYLIAANFTALSAVCSFRHRPSFDILAVSIPREVVVEAAKGHVTPFRKRVESRVALQKRTVY